MAAQTIFLAMVATGFATFMGTLVVVSIWARLGRSAD